jgi:hypothetical protein
MAQAQPSSGPGLQGEAAPHHLLLLLPLLLLGLLLLLLLGLVV